MNRKTLQMLAAAPLFAGLVASPALAKRHHKAVVHHSRTVAAKDDHGNCLRFNKTTGTIAGAVAGGLLGRAIDGGGSTGTLLGAAGGGLAGHSLARDGRKRC